MHTLKKYLGELAPWYELEKASSLLPAAGIKKTVANIEYSEGWKH